MSAKISKPLFYILSVTWGCIMTAIGAIVALVLLILGYRPKKWNYCYYFEVGENWGGIELGMFFITDKSSSIRTKNHEHGHGIQNCYLGVFMPFVVCIPSAARYWLREFKTQKTKRLFAVGLFGAFVVLASLLSLIPILTGIYGWFTLPALIVAYGAILLAWLLCHEIPQYANNTYVDYDYIWFEHSATQLGTELNNLLKEKEI